MFLRVKTHSANYVIARMKLTYSGAHIFFLIIIKILKMKTKNHIYKSDKFLSQACLTEENLDKPLVKT